MTQSITFKGVVVGLIMLILLIPQSMILNLIEERKDRSVDAIERINEKWSKSQVVYGPILSIPYITQRVEVETIETGNNKKEKREKIIQENQILNITPDQLNIGTKLSPEGKHYGIYKTILYKSDMSINGTFKNLKEKTDRNYDFQWDKAYISIGLSDLKGVNNQVKFQIENQKLDVEASGATGNYSEQQLIMFVPNLKDLIEKETVSFDCEMNLNGSNSLNFIPVGRNTNVTVAGAWKSPGFVGNFSPDSEINGDNFSAKWNVLHFNRNIPEMWINEYSSEAFYESYFGVNLVETVDHYQQNARSAKYALMFIALTFTVFFFVEILTKKRIHPIQYFLVGIALIIFYSLLLSISEQINFGIAYLSASIATIGLITAYAYSIFKNKVQTSILAGLLCILYTFLYVILQSEETSLLIGSVGLFIILGVIMFVSRKINFYKPEEHEDISENEI